MSTQIRVALGVVADLIAVVTASWAVLGTVMNATSERQTAFLLIAAAVSAGASACVPWTRRWPHEVARFTLVGVVAAVAGVLLIENPGLPKVVITSPSGPKAQQRCLVQVGFIGDRPRGQRFVLATRQDSGSYYFEGAVQQDGAPDKWLGTVQIGFADSGLSERYDILVFSMPEKWVDYLKTMRIDQNKDNTWWVSPGLPPKTGDPVATVAVTRSDEPDKSCRG